MFTLTSFELLIFLYSLSMNQEPVKEEKMEVAQAYLSRAFTGWCVASDMSLGAAA